MSPTATLVEEEDLAGAAAALGAAMTSFTLATAFATGPFFFAGAAAGSATEAFLLRSSTGIVVVVVGFATQRRERELDGTRQDRVRFST